MPRNITVKQERFAQEYVKTGNATEAYRLAYNVGSETKPTSIMPIASKTLKHYKVSARVRELQESIAHRNDVSADRVIKEYARLAFADMRDYIKFGKDGDAYLDWDSMPPEATKAIAEITQEQYVEGKGSDARTVRKTRFKLHDKKGALDSLAKHLGLFAANENPPPPPPVQPILIQVVYDNSRS